MLARFIKARWISEPAHQQLREELGLDHFESRSWTSLLHHTLMTMIAHTFLKSRRLQRARGGKESPDRSKTELACASKFSRTFTRLSWHDFHTAPSDSGLHAALICQNSARFGPASPSPTPDEQGRSVAEQGMANISANPLYGDLTVKLLKDPRRTHIEPSRSLQPLPGGACQRAQNIAPQPCIRWVPGTSP